MLEKRTLAKISLSPFFQAVAFAGVMAGGSYAVNTTFNHNLDDEPAVKTAVSERYRARMINDLQPLYKKYSALHAKVQENGVNAEYNAAKEAYYKEKDRFGLDLILDTQINEQTYRQFAAFSPGSHGSTLDESWGDSLDECRVEYLNSVAGTQTQIAERIRDCASSNNQASGWATVLAILVLMIGGGIGLGEINNSEKLKKLASQPKTPKFGKN